MVCLAFELQRVKFLGLDQDVMPFGVFIALDDLFLWHLFEAMLGLDTLEVFDGLSTRLMDHTESNGALRRDGRKHPDGNENEG